MTDVLKKFKNKNAINEGVYKKSKPVGLKPGTLHGSAELCKTLKTHFSDIKQNDSTIQHSFTFVDEVLTEGSNIHISSLDVDALLTNIILNETIDICVKKLFENPETLVKGISKIAFCDLLTQQTFAGLQDVFKTSSRHVFSVTNFRHPTRLEDILQIRLEDVLKMS